MAENHDLLKCPLCQGHGELLRSELTEQLANGDLQPNIEAYLAEGERAQDNDELASVAAPSSRDFQKDVHCWNPQLPMWRRSPKE